MGDYRNLAVPPQVGKSGGWGGTRKGVDVETCETGEGVSMGKGITVEGTT